MTRTSLHRVAALAFSLGFTLASLGCLPDEMSPESAFPVQPTAGTGQGSAGARAPTVIAGASAVGIAGSGAPNPGASGMRAGGGNAPIVMAGSGESGAAGLRAAGNAGNAGNAGARAAGSGGTPVAGSGAAGATATGGGTIWMPKPGVTWQWQLTGNLDTSVDARMFDIDLFTTPAATIEKLHAAGKIVVCYFSGGSYEPGRPDSEALSRTELGSTLDGWPDEKWLDIRLPAVRDVMKARLDAAKMKGCDGVEPDNVDGFDNDNGLGLTAKDALDYNRFLATESHARGLSIGLKNSLSLASMLVSSFDWALNEECLQYDECDSLEPFIEAGKAVFHCEYGKSANGICGAAPEGFSTIVKNLDLDVYRLACD